VFVVVELREGAKEEGNDRSINNVIMHNICEGRGHKDMY
jgi:hypothetical protein